jgi:hypothetical protein
MEIKRSERPNVVFVGAAAVDPIQPEFSSPPRGQWRSRK